MWVQFPKNFLNISFVANSVHRLCTDRNSAESKQSLSFSLVHLIWEVLPQIGEWLQRTSLVRLCYRHPTRNWPEIWEWTVQCSTPYTKSSWSCFPIPPSRSLHSRRHEIGVARTAWAGLPGKVSFAWFHSPGVLLISAKYRLCSLSLLRSTRRSTRR